MKHTIKIGILAIPLLVGAVTLATAQERPAGATNSKPAQASQHMQHRRGPKQFTLAGAEGAQISLWKPDLTVIPLQAKMDTVTIPPTGMDNYHAIVAFKDWGNSQESVIRYEYLRGKPSGQSPTKLSSAIKTTFEVVPNPIPRGHYHYHTDQEWEFMLRFKDRPIPNHPVTLSTANGSAIKGFTDDRGIVSFLLPDDFPDVVKGARDRREADFSVSAEFSEAGINYQSMLSAEYRLSQKHWKFVNWGVLVGGLGLIVGGFLGRVKDDEGDKA